MWSKRHWGAGRRVYTESIYLFEVLEQATLMSNDKNQISGCLLIESWVGGGVRDVTKYSEDGNVLCHFWPIDEINLYTLIKIH